MANCQFTAPNGEKSLLHAGLSQLLGTKPALVAWYALQRHNTEDAEPSLEEGLQILKLGTHQQIATMQQFQDRWKLTPINGRLFTYYGTEKLAQAIARQLEASGNLYKDIRIRFDKTHGMIELSPRTGTVSGNQQVPKTYKGPITSIAPDEVFVFGANDQGLHGRGAAGVAMGEQRSLDAVSKLPKGTKGNWAVVGEHSRISTGTNGNGYGLVTVEGTIGGKTKANRMPTKKLAENVDELYATARANPDKSFLIAYSGEAPDTPSLSGFTPHELAAIFKDRKPPANIVFEEAFNRLMSEEVPQEVIGLAPEKPEEHTSIDITLSPDKKKPLSPEQVIDNIHKLFTRAMETPDKTFTVPFTGESPSKKMYGGFSALDLAAMMTSQGAVPENLVFDPSFQGLMGNVPRKFLGTEVVLQDQTIRNPIAINEKILKEAQAQIFVEIRDVNGKGTGKFFQADQQIEIVDGFLYQIQNIVRKKGSTKVSEAMGNIRDSYQQWLRKYTEMAAGTRTRSKDGTDPFAEITQEMAQSYKDNMENLMNTFEPLFRLVKQRLKLYGINIEDLSEKALSATENTSLADLVDENPGKGLVDWIDDVFALDPKDTASGRLKLFVGTLEDVTEGKIGSLRPVKIPLNDTSMAAIIKGDKQFTFRTPEQAGMIKLVPGLLGQDTGGLEINGVMYQATANKYMSAKEAEDFNNSINKEQHQAKAGDMLIELKKFDPEAAGFKIQRSFIGMPKLTNLETVLEKAFGLLAGRNPDFATYMKLLNESPSLHMRFLAHKLRQEATPIEVRKEFVSVMTKAYKEFTIMMFSQGKDHAGNVYTMLNPVNANRYSIKRTIVENWKENQKISPIVDRRNGNYIMNSEVIKGLTDRFNEVRDIFKRLDTEGKKAKGFDADMEANLLRADLLIKDLFRLNGIIMPDIVYVKLRYQMEQLTKGEEFPGDFASQFNVNDDGSPAGMFSAFVISLNKAIDQESEDTSMFAQNNPLYKEEKTMDILSRIYAQHADVLYSSTHRDSQGKSVWDYSLNTYLTHTARELTDDVSPYRDGLLQTDFAKNNWLLKMMSTNGSVRKMFSVDYLDGIKNRYGKDSGVSRAEMSNREQLLLSLGLFQNGGRKSSSYLSLTHSDKSMTPVFRGIYKNTVLAAGNRGANALPRFYDLFKGEFDRISRLASADKGTYKHLQYEAGGHLFYQIPAFNYSQMQELVATQVITKEEMGMIWLEKGTLNTKSSMTVEFKEAVNKVLNNFMDNLVTVMQERFQREGIVTASEHMFDRGYVRKLNKSGSSGVVENDGKYQQNVAGVATQLSREQYIAALGKAVATDYALNAFLFNTAISQLITGDPAEMYKPVKGGGTEIQNIESTMQEYQKRMAGIIAPGKDGAVDREETYQSVTLKDITLALDYVNDAYGKVELTDGQELTTVREHLYMMSYYGVIKDSIYKEMVAIIDKAGPGGYYTFDDNPAYRDVIMQIMKPVYFGARNQEDGAMLHDYIKTSSYPLYPPFTVNSEIDKLRVHMEKNDIQRAVFLSGQKVGAAGAVQVFSTDGTINQEALVSTQFDAATQSLKRGGLRLQQETPYEEDKYQILTVSQMDVLITKGISDIEGFQLSGYPPMKGDQLIAHKAALRTRMLNDNLDDFKDKVGAVIDNGTLGILDKNKFMNRLVQAAKDRGYNDNDISALVMRFPDGTPIIPIFLTTAAQTYESMMMSLVNDIVKVKIDGKSFIQASSAGIQKIAVAEDTDMTNKGIVWVNGHDGKTLKMMRRSEDGKTVHAAQVVVPFSFFTKDGKTDITKFMKDGVLDMDKIPAELLQWVGARIPCQGHNSMIALEIVGFLPDKMGDMIIVPEGITVQMGSDFDVDKLYTYRRPHLFRDGKFSTIKPGDPFTMERLGADDKEFRSLVFATNVALANSGAKANADGRYPLQVFNKELAHQVDMKYPDGNVPKHTVTKPGEKITDEQKLKADYFDVHWSILTHPQMYDEVTKPLDNDDLKSEAGIAPTPNRTSFFDVGRQMDDFNSQKDAKRLVSYFALNTKFSAQSENKDMFLGEWGTDKNDNPVMNDTPISIFRDEVSNEEIKLWSLSNNAVGTYVDEKTGTEHVRTKHDNVRTMLSEVVDHAKHRTIDKLNLTVYTHPVAAAITLLGSKEGVAATLKHVSRFLQQEGARMYSEAMAKGSDSLSEFTKDIRNKTLIDVYNQLMKNAGITEEQLKDIPHMNFSPKELLALVRTTVHDKAYWTKQLVLFEAFRQFEAVGKRINEMQSLLNQATKGAGANMISVMDKLSKFNDVLKDNIIINGKNMYTGTEQGRAFDVTIHTAAEVYDDILPYGRMFPVVQEINKMMGNKEMTEMSGDAKYEVIKAMKSYVFSGIVHDTQAERARLFYSTEQGPSLAERVQLAKETEWGKKNWFLSRLRSNIEINGPSHVSYIASKVTSMDDLENIRGWMQLLLSPDPAVKFLGEDLLKYTYLTGGIQDAGSFAKYIPFGYTAATDTPGYLTDSFKEMHLIGEGFIRQFFQHNPQKAIALSEGFRETGRLISKLPESFILPVHLAGDQTNPAINLLRTVKGGKDYPQYLSYRDKASNRWILYMKSGLSTQFSGPTYNRIDVLGDKFTDEYTRGTGMQRSLIPVNRAFIEFKSTEPLPEDKTIQDIADQDDPGEPPPWEEEPIFDEVSEQLEGEEMNKETFHVHPTWQKAGIVQKFTSNAGVNSQVLEHISSNVHAPMVYRELARLMQGMKQDPELQKYILEEQKKVQGEAHYSAPIIQITEKAGAWYSFPSQRIGLSNNPSTLVGTGTEIVLHELMHAHTLPWIDMYARGDHSKIPPTIIRAVERLYALYEMAKERIATPMDYDTSYSMSNFAEFVAHAIHRKSFMQQLNEIELGDDTRSFFTRMMDAFADLFEAISEFIGVPINKNSLLHEAVVNITQIMHHGEYQDFTGMQVIDDLDRAQREAERIRLQSFDKKYELFPGVFANEAQRLAIDMIPAFVANPPKGGQSFVDRCFVLSGAAGTGKTTVIRKVLEAMRVGERDGPSVAMSAPSHNAVAELKEALGDMRKLVSVKTIQSELRMKKNLHKSKMLGRDVFERSLGSPAPKPIEISKIIIIDESSMLDNEMMQWISEVTRRDAIIIFMGDQNQLPAINQEEDAIPFSKIMHQPGHGVNLIENMRASFADVASTVQQYRDKIDDIRADPNLQVQLPAIPFADRVNSENITYLNNNGIMVDEYAKAFDKDPDNPQNALLVVYRNTTRHLYNDAIRKRLWGTKAALDKYAPGELLILNAEFPVDKDIRDMLMKKYDIDGLFNMQRIIVKEASEEPDVVVKRVIGSDRVKKIIELKGVGIKMLINLGPRFGNEEITIRTLGQEQIKDLLSRLRAPAYDKVRGGQPIEDKEIIDMLGGTTFLHYSRFLEVEEAIKSMALNEDYGYAVTSHKAQGSTYTHAFVDEYDISSISPQNATTNQKLKSTYVGVSRASKKLYVYHPANPAQTAVHPVQGNLQAASNTLMNGSNGPWLHDTDPEDLHVRAEQFPGLQVTHTATGTPGTTQVSFTYGKVPPPERRSGYLQKQKPKTSQATSKVGRAIEELERQKENIRRSFVGEITKEQRADKNQKIKELEDDMKKLEESGSLALIPEIAEHQLKWVQTTLDKADPSANEIMSSHNVIELWANIIPILYGEDATGQVGTPSADVERVAGKAASLREKINVEKMRIKLNELSQTKQLVGTAFTTQMEDVNPFVAKALSINRATSPLTQEVMLLIQNTARNRDEEGQELIARLSKLQKMMQEVAGPGKEALQALYNEFMQDNESGNAWGVVGKYSQDWYDYRFRIREMRNKTVAAHHASSATDAEKRRGTAQAWKDYWKKIDEAAIFIDTMKFFDEATGDLKAGHESYLAELEKEIGKDFAAQQVDKAQARYKKYLDDKEAAEADIEAKRLAGEYTDPEALAERNAWVYKHSPNLFFQNRSGSSNITTGNQGEWYAVLTPRASKTKYYDSKFAGIQADSRKLAIYNEVKAILEGHRKMLPMYVQHDMGSNFLPVVQQHLTGEILMNKNLLHTLSSKAIDALTASQYEMDAKNQDRIPIRYVDKGRYIGKDGSTSELSHDLPRIMEIFGLMAIHYKHFARAKDAIDMGYAVIQYIDMQRRSTTTNPNGLEVLTNTLGAIAYARDHLMYKRPKELEGNLGAKLYSLNPVKQLKIAGKVRAVRIKMEMLDEDYSAQTTPMTQLEYEEAKDLLIKELSDLESQGRTLHASKVADMLIKINQLKALAFNPFSGFANLSFGMISMWTHANGRADFTIAEANTAWKYMMNSTKKWITFGTAGGEQADKILSVINRLGIENDIVDSQYGEGNIPGRKSKVKRILNPFELMRSTDYYMKGNITVAMLLHSKLKVIKDGAETEMSMWEALDKEGKFKYKVVEDGWDNADPTKNDKWIQYRNKTIRVNQIIMGNMDKNSPKWLSKTVLGRLVAQFRLSWLPEGIHTRFEEEKYDIQLGRGIKGRYRTYMEIGLMGSMQIQIKQLMGTIMKVDPFTGVRRSDGKLLSPADIENMRRNFTGLAWTMGMMLAIMAIKALIPDKDEDDNMQKEVWTIAMNLMNRNQQDLTFYSSPDVANTVFRNVVPAMDVINDTLKATAAFNKAMFSDTYGWDKAILKFTHAVPYLNLINKFSYMSNRDLSTISR